LICESISNRFEQTALLRQINIRLEKNWGDAGNRNPRKSSSAIPNGFKQPFRHSNSAFRFSHIPRIPIQHSRGRTKSVPHWSTPEMLKTKFQHFFNYSDLCSGWWPICRL
jgi:hypothetical protein